MFLEYDDCWIEEILPMHRKVWINEEVQQLEGGEIVSVERPDGKILMKELPFISKTKQGLIDLINQHMAVEETSDFQQYEVVMRARPVKVLLRDILIEEVLTMYERSLAYFR